MRLQKGETKHKAPHKADTEGGGKFSNKADDFMTFHRDVQDLQNYSKMEIHVRKIKEVETGGGYTPYETPYILEMQRGMCRYADVDGFDAIRDYWMKKNRPFIDEFINKPESQPMQPNKTFEIENVTEDEMGDLYKLKDNCPF